MIDEQIENIIIEMQEKTENNKTETLRLTSIQKTAG